MICEVEFCVTRIFHQASDSSSIPFYVLDPFVLDCVGQAAEKDKLVLHSTGQHLIHLHRGQFRVTPFRARQLLSLTVAYSPKLRIGVGRKIATCMIRMSFGIYVAGYAIMIVGLAMGAYYLRVAPHWIAVGAVVLIGIGVLSGVAKTRQKDPS